jgi:hypothetical protein
MFNKISLSIFVLKLKVLRPFVEWGGRHNYFLSFESAWLRRHDLRLHLTLPYACTSFGGVFKLLKGKGAGYIGGWTVYLGWNCWPVNRYGVRVHRWLSLGWTNNGNRVPLAY